MFSSARQLGRLTGLVITRLTPSTGYTPRFPCYLQSLAVGSNGNKMRWVCGLGASDLDASIVRQSRDTARCGLQATVGDDLPCELLLQRMLDVQLARFEPCKTRLRERRRL